MTKIRFNQQVEELLSRAKALRIDDYYGAISVVRDFENLAHQYHPYLNQFTTEHVGSIETDFEHMRRYKRNDLKAQYFNSGKKGLISDIESMKMNRVPE